MSVFQLQEWWSVKVGQDVEEEFDASCFSCGNIDNSFPSTNKIIVGSLSGMLRMYNPTRPNYHVEDLVLEELLEGPILQVLLGRFLPGSELLGIAILHPRQLVVYEVLPQAVKDDRVSYYSLKKVYKHDLGQEGLHFTAFNMISGNFGGVRGRDLILVQSMDGKWQIFEQSAHAFTCQLSDCLIPGPLVYIPKIDAFVTINYAGQACCYRYQVLASTRGEETDKAIGNSSSIRARIPVIRKSSVEWSIDLGGDCNCHLIFRGNFTFSNNSSDVKGKDAISELLLVGDHDLFLVKGETGGLIQQRRYDRGRIITACTVPVVNNSGIGHNIIIIGEDGNLQIYTGFHLVWAASIPSHNRLSSNSNTLPQDLSRSTFPIITHAAVESYGQQVGLITLIDDMGNLSIFYLGTTPPVHTVLSQVRDLDYDRLDEEHRALLQVIRDAQQQHDFGGNINNNSSMQMANEIHNKVDINSSKIFDGQLSVRIQASKQFDLENFNNGSINLPSNLASFPQSNYTASYGGYVKYTVRVYLTYGGPQPATSVSLVISCTGGDQYVHVVPKSVVLEQVVGSSKATPVVVKFTFFASKGDIPSSLEALLTASYVSHKGDQHILTFPVELPLFLIIRPRPPTKTAPCKIILDTQEYPAVSLTELFSDVLFAHQDIYGLDQMNDLVGNNAAQAMGFQFHGDTIVKINTDLESFESGPAVVSILASKNAGRYRIQADSFPSLYLIVAEYERRLTESLCNSSNNNLQVMSPTSKVVKDMAMNRHILSHGYNIVTCADNLPLDEYFDYISLHLKYRLHLKAKIEELGNTGQQYRMIEKRLLVRFKDKNPTSLHGLDMLLVDSYNLLVVLADDIDLLQKRIAKLREEIECFSKLIVCMIGMKLSLPHPDRVTLQSYLCPVITDGTEQGWEETVNSSISNLLKTSLNKGGGRENTGTSSLSVSSYEMPKNIDLLKKNFLTLLDRLEKGVRLVASNS